MADVFLLSLPAQDPGEAQVNGRVPCSACILQIGGINGIANAEMSGKAPTLSKGSLQPPVNI